MFSKITLALAGLFTLVTADVLPGTFIISVIDSSGTTLGTLNGYGNFSSPGYPFTTSATSGDYSLSGYDLCSVSGTPALLACYDNSASAVGQFDVSGTVAPVYAAENESVPTVGQWGPYIHRQ
jgi:hypothetical protein